MARNSFDLGVFDRVGHDELTATQYNLVIGGMILYGLFINLLMVLFINPIPFLSINPIILLVAYIGFVFGGSILMAKSDKPVVSFMGYNMIVLPIGIILNIILLAYDLAVINNAIVLTFGIVGLFMTLGSLYPNFFLSIGRALFMTLVVVIIAEIASAIFFPGALTFADYIIVALFSGYIGYDVARANAIPRTLDNAIDVAAAIYLDIINIFIRILRILSKD